MNEEIIKLASTHCYGKTFTWDGELKGFTFRLNNIEAFYRAAFNAGLEAADKRLEEMVRLGEASTAETSVGIDAIRALERKP